MDGFSAFHLSCSMLISPPQVSFSSKLCDSVAAGVKLRDSEKCKYCSERSRTCIRANAFRFRPVTSVKFNAGEEVGSAEQSLEFQRSQTWVDIPSALRFISPNTEGDDEDLELEPNVSKVADEDPTASEPVGQSSIDWDPSVEDLRLDSTDASTYTFAHRSSTSVDLHALHRTDSHNSGMSHDPPALINSPSDIASISTPINKVLESTLHGLTSLNPTKLDETSPLPTFSNPHSITEHSQSSIIQSPPTHDTTISPFSSTAFSPHTSLNLRWPVKSTHEARLFHHFLVHCTPWIDVCDAKYHFGKEVPKRAAQFPVILNGILGLASRHLWLLEKVPTDLSQPYIDNCLQALIVALEDPLAHWDENFLVAVILLRLHEEMGESDELCHHFGTARILNSISSFAADGGLRESASWVSLRQHIYVSLTSQQPLNLSLDNYRHSAVFRDFDDESWTNRIIFQFAVVLQHVFEESQGQLITRDKWMELNADVDEWERTKPWTFSALFMEPDAGKEFSGRWPALPTPQGVVAIGLQYYHLCKIILAIYSPHASLVGLAGVRSRRQTDAAIRKHIRIVIGYGVSNSHCGNAMFQGSHILSACGAYVVDKDEQAACIKYLQGLQHHIGWRTDKVVLDLQEQWSN
ncbi:hypothetical protein BU24DRAFT_463619 [Aaosphaeria arxii CBS 175.79]|uniref:Transcription factor domain-containing protein n=1 Tax=Aaosphaeria arxii CBS 175.79 TaxID=1450172 RepID=A0A6A5XNN8_9PLEO|nr:uncharacterized protein BU24DRAFT_463619 [Aaosphaeria arxii CBS 175.79]KAF2014875.1 hypothetical protein BU24DRAFT_463619 [Aaosphaeria arxii CBS 175.79]